MSLISQSPSPPERYTLIWTRWDLHPSPWKDPLILCYMLLYLQEDWN